MRLIEEVQPRDQRPRSGHWLAHRVKALAGLLSKRASLFVLFNLLYGVVFATHLAHLFQFSPDQGHYPHLGLILLGSLYLLYIRRQDLFSRAEYCARGGILLVVVGLLCYLLGLRKLEARRARPGR